MRNLIKVFLRSCYTIFFVALLSCVVSAQGKIDNDPEVITINKSVKTIKNQQDCGMDKWNNSQDNSCQCCLTYSKGHFGTDKTADQIIDHCINTAKQCTAASITNIKKKYNAESMSSEAFLNTLYNETATVSKMTVNPSSLGPEGTLTEDGLATILMQAHKEGKLKNKEFTDKKCLKIKSLNSGSSYMTSQLFLVTSTCVPQSETLYIVKESVSGLSETMNLKRLEEFRTMKDIITPKIKKDFPSLALPLFYFSYHPDNQKIHYIATMPAAKGMVLCELLTQFRNNQSPENTKRLERAYGILGKELSNLHKQFMKPEQGKANGKVLVHGDLHCHNVFYDEKLGHFTFIDNDTMAFSLDAQPSRAGDFIRLFFTPFSNSESLYSFDKLITGIKPGTYFNTTLKPFLQGYISTYSPAEQKKELLELKGMLTSELHDAFFTFDQKYIQQLAKDYITPIFNELEKSIGTKK